MQQSYDQAGGTPPNTLTFGICEEESNSVTTPTGIIQKNSVLCFPSNNEMRAVNRPGFKGYSLSISENYLSEVAESCAIQVDIQALGKVQLVKQCEQSDIAAIRQALSYVSNNLSSIQSTLDHESVVRELEFDLARKLLMVLTNSSTIKQFILTHRKQLAFQRSRAYIAENPQKPITVSELAKASGCGVRTLELIFRAYYGVTPKYYLKSRRLFAVKHELDMSPASTTLVSDVAARWGFWHMSQFARDYSECFGELPSETLKKNS